MNNRLTTILPDAIYTAVQGVADRDQEGNMSRAARMLIREALAARGQLREPPRRSSRGR